MRTLGAFFQGAHLTGLARDARKRYTKPPLSPSDLLQHLLDRGLHAPTSDDRLFALRTLEHIDYYRLLGYMRPLQAPDTHKVKRFYPGTTLRDVLALYDFDRELRVYCIEPVERIEVALRAAIVSEVAVVHGSHFYMDPSHYTHADGHARFCKDVEEERLRHQTMRHYDATYSDPDMPPVWVAMEAITFGCMSKFFSNLKRALRKAVATRFGLPENVLISWFRSVNLVRNIVAHHGRLWNAQLHVNMPKVPAAFAANFNEMPNTFYDRAVAMIAIMENIDAEGQWAGELIDLLQEHPHIKPSAMGFPDDWRQRPIWT